MALIPNTPFTEGQVWTPELAYESFQAPYFDDQTQYLGHRQRILDSELSNTAGQLKQRFNTIEQALLVSVQSGLTLKYLSGSTILPSGTLTTIASGLVLAPDNTTSYVFVDELGVVKCSSNPPVLNLLLAKVVTVGGAVSDLQDWRNLSVRRIQPKADAVKVFGGSNTTDLVATQGQLFTDGAYYYRNFTVPAGVTITIQQFAKFYCSGRVVIDGTVNITTLASGATGYGTRVYGYQGNVGGLSGGGAGAGSGGAGGILFGSSGSPYSYVAQPYGSGGGLGFAFVTGAATNWMDVGFGSAGSGGGGMLIEAYRDILVTGTIIAKGGDAKVHQIGADSFNAGNISGSGGGSGGLILLSSLVSVTATPTATLNVNGGRGGDGYRQGGHGLGGGGGQIVLMSPSNNTTGAALLFSGGGGGLPGTTTPNLVVGGTGGGFGGQGGTSDSGEPGKLILRNFVPIG